VAKEGPFSKFASLHRILTVITGETMLLKSPHRTIEAVLGHPVLFGGEEEIAGFLPSGPVRDFNLIYDPVAWEAQVNVGTAVKIEACHWADAEISALYSLSGTLQETGIGQIRPECGAILRPGKFSLRVEGSYRILCVDLRARIQT